MAEQLGRIVLQAGDIVLRAYDARVPIRLKADSSPVCAADESAEAVILAALASDFPHIPVVAEEAVSRGAHPSIGETFFLVDPLDGTREFAARNGEFTVNIALIRDGAPICGVVYAPVFRMLYGGFGAEAWKCQIAATGASSGMAERKPIRVRKAGGDLDALVSRSSLDAQTSDLLARLPMRRKTPFGSSIKFCMIADGEADLYPRLGPTMEWDTAAGDAILRAAGGAALDLKGEPLRYGDAAGGFHNPFFVACGDAQAAARIMDALPR
jgi:3'(2'), 5'-bisphosphate nucleotidase